jgi:hypothetical protein
MTMSRAPNGSFTGDVIAVHADRIAIFEAVRAEIAPDAPSRNTCLFVFATQADAVAAQGWFRPGSSPDRVLIEDGAKTFLGDADLYSHAGAALTMREAACRYWLGLRSERPVMEYLVQGAITYPDWQSFQPLA